MPKLSHVFILLFFLLAPYLASAAATWQAEISDYQEPVTIPSYTGFFSFLRAAVQSDTRPPIGTTFTVESTAYAPSPLQTDATPCITAAGTRVRQGVVASNFLPLGTLLDINGQRYIVEDRTSPRFNVRLIDIWFPSTSKALEFGRRRLEVTVVGYGTPGQELIAPLPEMLDSDNRPDVLTRLGLRLKSWTLLAQKFIGANVNQHDVDCFST